MNTELEDGYRESTGISNGCGKMKEENMAALNKRGELDNFVFGDNEGRRKQESEWQTG